MRSMTSSRRSRVMPVEGRAPASDALAKERMVKGIGDEPYNPGKDQDAPAQALCEGQGGAFLSVSTCSTCLLRECRAVPASHRLAISETVSMKKPPTGEPYAGKPPVRLCVERRLACSAGGRPAGATVRSPVVWIAGWRETKTLKPIDKISLGEITVLRGWVNYFAVGHSSACWTRWSRPWLYETLKLFNSYRVRRSGPKVAPAG